MTAALTVGLLAAAGTYLILRRERLRIIIGFVLLGHAVNVLFVAAGGMGNRDAPLVGESDLDGAADPLPQAFVLTAIVITFGITVYLLAMLHAELAAPPAGSQHDGDPPEDGAPSGDGDGPTMPHGRSGAGQDGSPTPAPAADPQQPGIRPDSGTPPQEEDR